MTKNRIDISVGPSNSAYGSNLRNYSETYDKWDSEDGQECPACYGTGLDRDEVFECPTCYGEGIIVRLDAAL